MKPYYQDAAVTLYHGDCLEVLPLIESVDHVITDPPYDAITHADHLSSVAHGRASIDFEAIGFGQFVALCDRLVSVAARWVVMTCDYRHAPGVFGCDYFVRLGVWVKSNGAPQFTGDRPGMGYEPVLVLHRSGRKRWNGGGKHGIWYAHVEHGEHPTQKPASLAASFISDFTDEGDLILDPFGGSGTTGVAAKRLGRRCILIEKEEKYCAVAAERLLQGALDLGFSNSDAVDPQVRVSADRSRAGDLF